MKISIILYESKTLADGPHPLMVHINQLKAKKYFSTGFSCPSELWDFVKHTPKRKHSGRTLLKAILAQKKVFYHKLMRAFVHRITIIEKERFSLYIA
jgi:hypothetical protein